MLHHHQRVAQIPQSNQGVEQAVVIPLMQADAGFIQHVQHPGEAGSDLGCQADALRLAAGQGHRRSVKTEVIQPHIQQETQAKANLTQHQIADLDLTGIEQWCGPLMGTDTHQLFDPLEGFTHTHGGEFRNPEGADLHRECFGFQPLPAADFTGHQFQKLLQFLTLGFTAGIPQLALKDRKNALERTGVAPLALAIPAIGLNQNRFTAAVQQHITLLIRELVPRRLDLEAERFSNRKKQ